MPARTTDLDWRYLLTWAGGCLALGLLSGSFTFASVENWYQQLIKPPGTPPGWVFGPVWSVLYVCIGLAGGLLWRSGEISPEVRWCRWLFGLQLCLNLAWSYLFFGLQCLLCGLVDMALLLVVLMACLVTFRRISKASFYLFVPYVMWVTYAGYLVVSLWFLNG